MEDQEPAELPLERSPRASYGGITPFSALLRPLRIAVCLWIVALGSPPAALAVWPFSTHSKSSAEDARLGERAAKLLARAIRIETVNPPGRERPLAELLVDVLRDADIEARVVPTPSGPTTPETLRDTPSARAAAWARVPGSGRERPIVLLSHLDVVAAQPAEWKVDPFAGHVEDGFVIGRGALDAKGISIVHLMTMLELAARETPLDRDVIFLATPDEESGGVLGAGQIVRERPELLGGAEFLLTEGGSVRTSGEDRPPIWGVTVTEKSPCWLEVASRGRPGHSSTPARDDAVPHLIAALETIRRIETPVRVLPVVARMFSSMAATAPPDDRSAYRDLGAALMSDSTFRRRFLAVPARNALVRNTISITVLEGGPATNVAPGIARAHIDARLLPDTLCEDFAAEIRDLLDDPGITLRTLLSFPPKISSHDTALFRAIERVAERTDPGALVVPRMIAGFTDAHYFRDIGIVAYGFVPRWLEAEETHGIHGADERVSIDNLERGTRTLVAILEELGR